MLRTMWRKKGTQAAREVRTSEAETPPRVPGDDPVGEKTAFWKTAAEVMLESKNDLPNALGDSPDDSG